MDRTGQVDRLLALLAQHRSAETQEIVPLKISTYPKFDEHLVSELRRFMSAKATDTNSITHFLQFFKKTQKSLLDDSFISQDHQSAYYFFLICLVCGCENSDDIATCLKLVPYFSVALTNLNPDTEPLNLKTYNAIMNKKVGVCGKSWAPGGVSFKCRTCQVDDTCLEFFLTSNAFFFKF